jgi:CRP-like cAMP-binding protein/uncharacterized protein (DUF2225 family)
VLRNIDFEALRSLRDRHGAAFPRGRVLFREGDTTAEFYVVLQGSVEISIKDPESGQKHVLTVIQPGGFFGEMSCFSGMARSATAVTAEDSVLLFFNQDTAIQLMRASPRFALGVIQTLCDRIRTNNERISRLSALVGDPEKVAATAQPAAPAAAAAPGPSANLAATVAAAASAARPAAVRDVPPPDYDKNQLWGKVVTCQVSNTRFMALNVRPEASQVKSRESDFREVVTGPNPLWYAVYACPECGYAAYPDDFATLAPEQTHALGEKSEQRKGVIGEAELNGERGRDETIRAFRLAIDCYLLREPDARRLGGLYHRLAWLYREAGDEANEKRYLVEAIKQYAASVDGGDMDGSAELQLLYTVGDLYLRAGSPVESVKWLQRASQHPEFRRQPEIARLLRDRWQEARDLQKARTAT